jgi:hypothetical protein
MAKDFCRIDNNGGSREESLSPDKSVQYSGQAGGNNQSQDNNRGVSENFKSVSINFSPFIPTRKVSLLIFAQNTQKSSGI